jgi:hypothetical protein
MAFAKYPVGKKLIRGERLQKLIAGTISAYAIQK